MISAAARFRLRSLLELARYAPLDLRDRALRRRDPSLPPRRLMLVGDGDFLSAGDEFVVHFQRLGGLQASSSVLDIGCGVGRMAIPLTEVLDSSARYVGFDVHREMIRWCQRQLTPRHPNFTFHIADVANAAYNPTGTQRASDYRFPCETGTIDFAFATSVFTHLPADASRRYIAETARVLRRGGRCLLTFFLFDEQTRALVDAGRADRTFAFDQGEHRSEDRRYPELAVAYEETWVRDELDANGLRLEQPIHWGSWSGRDEHLSYQDIVVAERI
jgi:SAM-dependent methyltransferase